MDAVDRMESGEFLEFLAAAIQAGDPDPFLAVNEIRIEEISRAYLTKPAESRANSISVFALTGTSSRASRPTGNQFSAPVPTARTVTVSTTCWTPGSRAKGG